MSVNAQLEGKEYIDVDEVPYKLDDLIPDITNFKRIHTNSINIERELGRVIKSIYYFFVFLTLLQREDLEWYIKEFCKHLSGVTEVVK